MNIHPRLLDGKLKILAPGESIEITISDKNPNHEALIRYMEEQDRREDRTKGA